jgi:hypothetical protein
MGFGEALSVIRALDQREVSSGVDVHFHTAVHGTCQIVMPGQMGMTVEDKLDFTRQAVELTPCVGIEIILVNDDGVFEIPQVSEKLKAVVKAIQADFLNRFAGELKTVHQIA